MTTTAATAREMGTIKRPHLQKQTSVVVTSSSSSSRDNGSSSSQNAPRSSASRSTRGRKRSRTFCLVSLFGGANLLSAITYIVFHRSHSNRTENWSSLAISDSSIIKDNLLLLAPKEGNNTSDARRPAASTAVSRSTAKAETEQQHISWSSSSNNTTLNNNTTSLTNTLWQHPTPRRSVVVDDAYPLLQPLTATTRQLLYKRIVQDFTRTGRILKPKLARGTCMHRNLTQLNVNQNTIEFFACCGLGHRLSRMSAAAHVATKLKAHLYGYWRCCNKVEVFSYLFGDEPIILYKQDDQGNNNNNNNDDQWSNSTTTTTTTPAIHLQFRNDVPGFKETSAKCSCTKDKAISDFAFYSTLRERYTKKHVVDGFVQQHFTNQTLSIAIHIRAGNGETGDFTNKNRQISDPAVFVRNTTDMIREIVAQNNAILTSSASQLQQLSPLVFIATDTPSYVDAFRKELASSSSIPIPVVTLPAQVHAAQGEGVLFGLLHQVIEEGEQCEAGWDAVLQDMLVMSHADIVLATTYSSFTQSLPQSLILGRRIRSGNDAGGNVNNKWHNIQAPFCDVRNDKLQCYKSVQQWCCTPAANKTRTYQDVVWNWRKIMLQ